ncbi:hypothetical protein chiPu_0020601 [Chiloscyllium punctatum]|uniref:Uncharacterized protein n=1 Tax=Chiloscyllium punctatum TaxID=137246 RepID=A0A401RHG9_CHIPU|nr:hypothetical protein [Chiloscyllium punctatum]
MINLTPNEMFSGRTMSVPKRRALNDGPRLGQLELELKQYMQQLTMIDVSVHIQGKLRKLVSAKGAAPIKCGDQAYERAFQRKWNDLIMEGAFTVTKVLPTAVLVE